MPLPTNQILCSKPKELYLLDITDVPYEIKNNKDNKLYLLSIIDHFTKFAQNYILTNKDKTSVLKRLKKFCNNYGYPDKILTDNGLEFYKNDFKKFCKKNSILLLHGRPRQPQNYKGYYKKFIFRV